MLKNLLWLAKLKPLPVVRKRRWICVHSFLNRLLHSKWWRVKGLCWLGWNRLNIQPLQIAQKINASVPHCFKFWAGSPERIRSCRVERRRILRSCWVHPRLACCFWAPFFLALLLTRYVVWAARYLATQQVAVLQVLAQVQMKPRWQNSAVEMQMALSPKSCPTAARETTTFSVASMPTILWIVWKRTLVSLLTVALVLWLPQDMVQTTANGPACGVPGVARAAWTVLGTRMQSHSNVQEWKFPRQLFAGELFVSQFASNACTGLLTELACLKSFVAGKAQAIASCSKAQINLYGFVQAWKSTFEHSLRLSRAKWRATPGNR